MNAQNSTNNNPTGVVDGGQNSAAVTENVRANKNLIAVALILLTIHVPLELFLLATTNTSYSYLLIKTVSGFTSAVTSMSIPVQDLLLGPTEKTGSNSKTINAPLIEHIKICGEYIFNNVSKKPDIKTDDAINQYIDNTEKYGKKSFVKNNGNSTIELINIKKISSDANKMFIGIQTAMFVSVLAYFSASVFSRKEISLISYVELSAAASYGRGVPGDESSPPKGWQWSAIVWGNALYWQTSGFLVSLGFLGTFVGLLTAAWAFPAHNVLGALVASSGTPDQQQLTCWTQELAFELSPQASAVRTAFATSVVGLGLAVLVRLMHAIHSRYAPENHQATSRRHRAIELAAQKIAQSFTQSASTAAAVAATAARTTPQTTAEKSGEPVTEQNQGSANGPISADTISQLNRTVTGLQGALHSWRTLETTAETQYQRRVEELQALRSLGQQVQELHRDTMDVVKAHNRSANEVREAVASLRQCITEINTSMKQLLNNISDIVTR